MKLLVPFIICVLFSTEVYATVFRVNNNLTTNKNQRIFSSIQEANDDQTTVSGDTLMIEGSVKVYENASLTKRLTLIGTGYFITLNPQTQANSVEAVVSQITIKAKGTVLIGLNFSNNSSYNAPYIEASDVIVMRCYLPNTLYLAANVENVQIIQNYFNRVGIGYTSSYISFAGIVLRNNIITGDVSIASNQDNQRSFGVVENNIFTSTLILTANFFRNNIISSTANTITITSGTIENNLFRQAGKAPSANGNQIYDETKLFVGSAASPDGQYRLKTDSPYKTSGIGGTEPGVFGGAQPYILSGLPPIPSIYEFTAESFVSKQTGLKVKLKAKANP
ncbi:hypothetical protein QNI19_32170 [Cytophagaceae bacterium DM2B3-1]|uniref:Right-handed parallel beta-helix repeat-containing protein n=1 Tax=Xanthocytophaga flava TaxID=3048013 RepID=A0ABT7CV41_9BACT|nr:hypothetical protein [Xanthocytophaga flavus]MDJ1497640.1 hypothetical protein [Xanthocytophaga flavus]